MTADRAGEVVPFGKYKGRPVEALVADREYRDWVLAQPWFRDRYANIYQVVVNYGAEPQDTPEHNAMQASFLDDGLCLRLARILVPESMADKDVTRALSETTAAGAGAVDLYSEFLAHLAVSRIGPVLSGRKFEDRGWDVTYTAKAGYPVISVASYPACSCLPCDHERCPEGARCRGGALRFDYCFHKNCDRVVPAPRDAHRTHHDGECPWARKEVRDWFAGPPRPWAEQLHVRVECKPDLGDDFPAVLRQVQRYGIGREPHQVSVVVVRRHAFEMVTFDQVRQMFEASRVRLVREDELRQI